MPGTRNSYLAFFMSPLPQLLARLLEHLRRRLCIDLCFILFLLMLQLLLIEQIDRLFDEGCLAVFEQLSQHGQPLGMTIADPALQPAVSFLFAFHVLALPFGVVLRPANFYFLAHITLQLSFLQLVISHQIFNIR